MSLYICIVLNATECLSHIHAYSTNMHMHEICLCYSTRKLAAVVTIVIHVCDLMYSVATYVRISAVVISYFSTLATRGSSVRLSQE